METQADRVAWIESVRNGRTVGSGLTPSEQPDLGTGTLAFKEALLAFAGGLFVSTVLAGYAAVEIMLVDHIILRHVTTVASLDGQVTSESVKEGFAQALDDKEGLGQTKAILAELTTVGLWIDHSSGPTCSSWDGTRTISRTFEDGVQRSSPRVGRVRLSARSSARIWSSQKLDGNTLNTR